MKWPGHKRRHCPHSDIRPIHGDEINHVGGWRLQCEDCGSYLYGPVSIAFMRSMTEKEVRP